MGIRQTIGWILVLSGLSLTLIPFFSGFTGYFIINSAAVTQTSITFDIMYAIIGLALASIGYLLIRPKSQSILGK